jgi:hypothetical protein
MIKATSNSMKPKKTNGFVLVCLAFCILAAGKISAQVQNSGFEVAGANSSLAANWTTTTAVGGPVFGIRTNDNPHSGSFNYKVYLASTGAGPLVEFAQTAVPVIGGATYTFSFRANRLTGSAGDSDQYNIQWFNTNSVQVGQTGYTSYTPGANVYAQTVVNGLAAPATAVTASILFHCAGAAIPSQSATIDFDDVSLTTTNVVIGGGGGTTNQFQITIIQGAGISWFASNGVPYQVQWTSTLSTNTVWNNLGSLITGKGSSNTVFDPVGPPHNFYHVLSIQ